MGTGRVGSIYVDCLVFHEWGVHRTVKINIVAIRFCLFLLFYTGKTVSRPSTFLDLFGTVVLSTS